MENLELNLSDATNEHLVELFKVRVPGAFDEIDRRYRAKLSRFFNSRVHSYAVSDDLAQETLMRALLHLDDISNGVFLSGWLFQIAYRVYLDWLRKRARDRQVVSYDDQTRVDDDSDGCRDGFVYASDRPPTRPNGGAIADYNPSELAVRRETRENIWRIAKRVLTDDEFKTIWMKYVERADDDETAKALGKAVNSVRTIAYRARNKLAWYLKDLNEE